VSADIVSDECVRFAYPSGGHKSRQNVPPTPECLRGAPQRWQGEWKDIQTIVEVAAKFIALHHVSQISVGRSYEPNVHLVSPGAAQALKLLLLQDTQQFGLQSRRNISHLVQEERPFVS